MPSILSTHIPLPEAILEKRRTDVLDSQRAPAVTVSTAAFCINIIIAFLTMLTLWPGALAAQELISSSSDVTIDLSASVVATDHDVVLDNQLGIVTLENLGALPPSSDIIAYGADTNGDLLFAFDTTVELPGSVVAAPGDIVRFDGSTFVIAFDASAVGLPHGVATDAFSIAPNDKFLFSFDTTVALPGGVVAADEDLVTWNGSVFEIVFDGSAHGLGSSLDIDAGQALGGGAYAMSFDTTGIVGSIVFADEDVLRFDGTTWSVLYDASAADSDWLAADLDAVLVPEPGVAFSTFVGALLLAGLSRSRSRGRRA